VLQALEISEATLHRWRAQYGGMKSEEAKRLKALKDENRRLKEIVADLDRLGFLVPGDTRVQGWV